MRAVLQRCQRAEVFAEEAGKEVSRGKINKGLVVLLSVENEDDQTDLDYLLKKVVNMRIFNDEEGKMNLSVKDVGGDIAAVSQFTLHANTKKGNRPSYNRCGDPDHALNWYDKFIKTLGVTFKGKVISGVFGAHMKIDFINDGPVTIILDSKDKSF